MVGLLAMVPLALTSNDWSVRKLGAARWQRLHLLTYPAALAGAVQYLWLVKAWPLEPVLYLAAVIALTGLRTILKRRATRPSNPVSSAGTWKVHEVTPGQWGPLAGFAPASHAESRHFEAVDLPSFASGLWIR